MAAPLRIRRTLTSVIGIALILAPAVSSVPQGAYASAPSFADPAFQRVWNHCDKPVQDRVAARSWMWGPENVYTGYEPYAQGPGGQHLVQYLDKSRMEINDPSGDHNSEWFVTNGLLVVDMIAGRFQVGDNQFLPATPANIPVAGDIQAQHQRAHLCFTCEGSFTEW